MFIDAISITVKSGNNTNALHMMNGYTNQRMSIQWNTIQQQEKINYL